MLNMTALVIVTDIAELNIRVKHPLNLQMINAVSLVAGAMSFITMVYLAYAISLSYREDKATDALLEDKSE